MKRSKHNNKGCLGAFLSFLLAFLIVTSAFNAITNEVEPSPPPTTQVTEAVTESPSSEIHSAEQRAEANKTFSAEQNENADMLDLPDDSSTNAPNATPTSTPVPNEVMVWVPNTGKKYHRKSGCSNMKNPTQITRSQAIARGYTACKNCW